MAWFKEKLYTDYAQSFAMTGAPLVDRRTQFQRIRIFDHAVFGRVMTLDDIVQITTKDECAYSEMLTHVPMLEHGAVKRVLIVGGGDGAIAEEALKHEGVEEVVLCEIDPDVIAESKKHLKKACGRAFSDKRLRVLTMDAFEYLGRDEVKGRFDLIISDRPDPVGPAEVLFADSFYERVNTALAKGGFAVFQTGVPVLQPGELTDTMKQIGRVFSDVGVYLTVVPTYTGGFMALTWAGRGAKLGTGRGHRRAAAAYEAGGLKTDHYNPDMHAAAFALPNWIAKLVP